MKGKSLITYIFVLLLAAGLYACTPVEPESGGETETQEEGTVEEVPDGVYMARDAVLAYLEKSKAMTGLTELTEWSAEYITPPQILGQGAWQLTSGPWMVAVSYPIVAPENVIYTVQVSNPLEDFMWSGTVLPDGSVTESVGSVPAERAAVMVTGWMGHIESLPAGGQWDDRVIFAHGAGEMGIEGENEALQAEIVALRDKEEPGKFAHFWGVIQCEVPDVGGCRLIVSQLRAGATATDPEPVEGWEGSLVSNPEGSQFEDFFELAGSYPLGFGIHSLDDALQAEMEMLLDTGTHFKVWGVLRTGVPDAFGAQIEVSRIEILS